ncbi:MAG: TetR family transcriptional regulator [Candidatus Saccharibacteria bacterium]|nr:TetR family transcriptional regulator [Pseudorhodobacter sp.]
MGITQPLLYRYFPSKVGLANAVYRAIHLDRWQIGRETTIRDTSRPIADRLQTRAPDRRCANVPMTFSGRCMARSCTMASGRSSTAMQPST